MKSPYCKVPWSRWLAHFWPWSREVDFVESWTRGVPNFAIGWNPSLARCVQVKHQLHIYLYTAINLRHIHEYMEGIWEMENFMKNIMVKSFRARTSAHASWLFCHLRQNLMILEFSKWYEIWCWSRAHILLTQLTFLLKYRCKFLVFSYLRKRSF